MLRSPLFALTALLSASSLVSGADICAYTSRDCVGGFSCCSNILPGACCRYPAGYGWSTKFQNMPANSYWFGTTYGDTCSTSGEGAGSSDGNICLSVFPAPNYSNAKSANWKADTRVTGSFEERDDTNCMNVNVIGFTTKDGKESRFEVPDDRTFGEVKELLDSGRSEGLKRVV